MERLILTLVYTDDFSYSNDVLVPFEYESLEAFFCLLDDAAQALADRANAENRMVTGPVQVGPLWLPAERLVRCDERRVSKRSVVVAYEKNVPDVESLDDWFKRIFAAWCKQETCA